MKKLFGLILCLVLVSSPALSEDTCTEMALYAEKIMEYRQNGKGILEAFKECPKFEVEKFPPENRVAFRKAMIEHAYKQPFYSTQEAKNRAVTDYMNEWYLLCLESGLEAK